MKNNKKILNFSFLIIGSVIGAGFASGKEILTFFSTLAPITLISLFIIFFGVYFITIIFAKIGQSYEINSLQDIDNIVFKKFSSAISFMIIISLLFVCSSMIAGVDSIGKQFIDDYNFQYLGIITVLLAIIVNVRGFKSLKKINSYLIFFLLFIISAMCFISLFLPSTGIYEVEINLFSSTKGLFFPILWLALNMFTLSFLVALDAQKLKEEETKRGGVLTAIIIVSCVFLVICALTKHFQILSSFEMPMLAIASLFGKNFTYFYAFILWISIFTTLISSVFSIAEYVDAYVKNKLFSTLIVCVSAYFISRFGFSFIVDVIYPIQGVLGVIYLVGCVNFYFKNFQIKKPSYKKDF